MFFSESEKNIQNDLETYGYLELFFFSISSIEKSTSFFAMSKPTKNIWVMNSEILKMGIPTYLQVGALTKP